MSIFKTPKTPAVASVDPLPPSPTRSDAETATLAEQQRNRLSAQGRAMTMLTSGSGVSGVQSASAYLGAAART